jgi:hypothetical protein
MYLSVMNLELRDAQDALAQYNTWLIAPVAKGRR